MKLKNKVGTVVAVCIVAIGVLASPLAASAEEPVTPETTEVAQVEETTLTTEAETTPAVEESAPAVEEQEPVTVEEQTATVAQTPAEQPVIEQWKIGRWILPNGGTPQNVTWPQPEKTDANLALVPCGTSVWIQVDQYPYTTDEEKARTDAMFADGILTNGEDHGWVVGWTFEEYTAPACVVIPPKPEPKVETRESFSLNCTADLVTTITEGRTNEPVYVAETNIWVDGEWSDWKQIDQRVREATDEECPPVVVPPIEEPPTPTPEEPKVTETPAPVTAENLAQTGGESNIGLLALAGLLFAGSATIVVARRIKASH